MIDGDDLVGTNAEGYSLGERHHRCIHSDEVVFALRDAHENRKLGAKALAEMFDMKLGTVRAIIYRQRRYQQPTQWRKKRKGE